MIEDAASVIDDTFEAFGVSALWRAKGSDDAVACRIMVQVPSKMRDMGGAAWGSQGPADVPPFVYVRRSEIPAPGRGCTFTVTWPAALGGGEVVFRTAGDDAPAPNDTFGLVWRCRTDRDDDARRAAGL